MRAGERGTDAILSGGKVRERFVLLDGMRGIAALAVVFFHLAPAFVNKDTRLNGQLAVDFFFCLSGFVLANAHDEQFQDGRLAFGRFAVMRLVRVAPMVILGSLVAIAALPFVVPQDDHPAGLNLLITSALSFVCLPLISDGHIYWINGVFWSLLAELLVNGLYGAIAPRLNNRVLSAAIALSGCIFAIGVFAFSTTNFNFYSINQVLFTIARASFSFFVGVALLRLAHANQLGLARLPAVLPIAALIAAVTWHPVRFNTIYNLVLIVFAIPSIVFVGSLAKTDGKLTWDLLGRSSFPLYAIHGPISLALSDGLLINIPEWADYTRIAIFVSLPAALIILAMCIDHFIDLPARSLLRRKFLTGKLPSGKC